LALLSRTFLSRRRGPGRFLAAAMLAALASAKNARSDAPAAPLEAQVKAAFVYNFAKFIDWPSNISPPKAGTFVIDVLGDSPVLGALNALDGQEVKGRRLVVRQIQRLSEASGNVLFVASRLRDLPILTVGEGDEFLRAGGMIALVQVDGKIRYRVRVRQAEAARLVISSKLLNLADRKGE